MTKLTRDAQIRSYHNRSLVKACQTEQIDLEIAFSELDAGRAVFLCSNTSACKSGFHGAIVGSAFRKKVTALVGLNARAKAPQEILTGMDQIIRSEPDCIMDLTTGKCAPAVWRLLKDNLQIPVGCGLTYIVFRDSRYPITQDSVLSHVREALDAGVDLILLHFGISRSLLAKARNSKRIMTITSRGAGMIARYMERYLCENPLIDLVSPIAKLCADYGVVLDLGDAFRSGCIADAEDDVKWDEIELLSKMRLEAMAQGCQVICESGGHMPLSAIPRVISRYKDHLQGCPLWLSGPMPLDVGIGLDSVVNAIGVATAAQAGGDLFCSITDSEHFSMPTPDETSNSVLKVKAAIAIAEVANGSLSAWDRNRRVSSARALNRWKDQIPDAILPRLAKTVFAQAGLARSGQPCGICGRFCPHLATDTVCEDANNLFSD